MRVLPGWWTEALCGLLIFAILTIWVQEQWAVSVFQTGVFGLGIVWCVRHMWGAGATRKSWLVLPVAAAATWAPVQVLARQTVYPWQTWCATLTWVANLTLFFLALQILGHERSRERFLLRLSMFGFVISVIATLQMFTSGGRIFWLIPSGYKDYVLGPFVYRNQYAAFIELLLPAVLWKFFSDRRRRVLFGVAAGAMCASVIASGSRAGSLLILAELAAAFAIASARRELSSREFAGSLAMMLVVLVTFASVVGWQTLETRLMQPDPFAVRRELLTSTLQMVQERPWFGFGLGTWATAYPAYALYDDGQIVNQAHNDWLQWAAEGGVPFMLLICLVLLRLAPRACVSLWGLGVVSVAIHALVDYPMQQRPALAAWFFTFLGALSAYTETRDAEVLPRRKSGEARAGMENTLVVGPLC